MTLRKVDRITCDFSDCDSASETGAKLWTIIRVIGGDTERDGTPLEKHVCPKHDQLALGQLLVGTKADTKRFERGRK
jgi:hypothetical protein